MANPSDFFTLIDQFNKGDRAEKQEICTKVDNDYGRTAAVLYLDMSGFTKSVRECGAVFYIAIIRRMNLIAERVVAEYDGKIVEFHANDAVMTFDDAATAFHAGLALIDQIKEDNRRYPENEAILTSLGLAYGWILDVPGYEINGDPINTASKLGEGLATKGEFFVDKSAYDLLPKEHQQRCTYREIEKSDVTFTFWDVTLS